MLSGLFYLKSMDRSISSRMSVWLVFVFIIKKKTTVFNSVCQGPFFGKPGMNGLSIQRPKLLTILIIKFEQVLLTAYWYSDQIWSSQRERERETERDEYING